MVELTRGGWGGYGHRIPVLYRLGLLIQKARILFHYVQVPTVIILLHSDNFRHT